MSKKSKFWGSSDDEDDDGFSSSDGGFSSDSDDEKDASSTSGDKKKGGGKFWGSSSDDEGSSESTKDTKKSGGGGGKFWGGSSSSTEESEDEDGSGWSSDEGPDLSDGSSPIWSSDSEEEERGKFVGLNVKLQQHLKDILEVFEEHMEDSDWVNCQKDFKDLMKWESKSLRRLNGVPTLYIRFLLHLNEFVEASFDESASERVDDGDDGEEGAAAGKAKGAKKGKKKKKLSKLDAKARNALRASVPKAIEKFTYYVEKYKEKTEKYDEEVDDEDATGLISEEAAEIEDSPKEKLKDEDVVWNDENVEERLVSILKKRGLKTTSKRAQLTDLRNLASNALNQTKRVDVLLQLISCHFDLTTAKVGSFMRPNLWFDTVDTIVELLDDVESLPVESFAPGGAGSAGDGDAKDESSASIPVSPTSQRATISSVAQFIERLDDELSKGLKNGNHRKQPYIQRLNDEMVLLKLAKRLQAFYIRIGQHAVASKLAALQLSLTYYKSVDITAEQDEINQRREVERLRAKRKLASERRRQARRDAAKQAAYEAAYQEELERRREEAAAAAEDEDGAESDSDDPFSDDSDDGAPKAKAKKAKKEEPIFIDMTRLVWDEPEHSEDEEEEEFVVEPVDPKVYADAVDQLAAYVYAHGDDQLKVDCVLRHIYFKAIHDEYEAARNMMLMSHLQRNITHMGPSTQILFNRAIAQIGLAAFRRGEVIAAHDAISDMCSVGRLSEFLAQRAANQRFGDKTLEQEKRELKLLVPFHMHINTQLLESVHLVCAMLLEVPHMAAHPHDIKPKHISRSFGKHMDTRSRQVFTGPPETIRDVMVCAAQCMLEGEWKRATEMVMKMDFWQLIPSADSIKEAVAVAIKERTLETYLYRSSQFYESMSLATLSAAFELDEKHVHRIVSKMMFDESLPLTWHQPTNSIVVHKVRSSKLQYLALQFSDKLSNLVESNERLMDSRNGGYGYKHDWKPGRDGGERDHHRAYRRRQTRYTSYSSDRRRGGNSNYRHGRRNRRS